ncbi:MAG: alpha/beta fold hydrolase, partial [Phycisphaeraceae bacterium]|nr:alpha/beta fold hydrolase [Phycisphaeraceae bacterium]
MGINRNYTEWAREAALSGVTTLRFDIRGLGDSRPRHPEDLNRLYRDETREDVIAAIDLLADRDDCDGVVLCGLCAGAYQAFHAARVDPRVVGLVLLDLLRWDPDGPLIRRRGFWTRRRQNLERWARAVRSFSGLGAWSEPTLLARGLCEMTD